MFVTKLLAPCLESKTRLTHDGAGDTRFFTACFKLLLDDLPVGLRHGADSHRFHLFMTAAEPSDRQCTKTNTSNDPALLGPPLHRMLNNPDPIVGRLLRASQFIIA